MISIIVPIYNSERYLQECISSVLKQVYQDFELLLIDDGSTDSSLEICRRFQREDSRIRISSRKHQGVSKARNIALDLAQGDYIFFLDSDDVLELWILERLFGQMQIRKAEMAFCRYSREPLTGDAQADRRTGREEWILLNHFQTIEQFSQNNRIFGGIGGKLVIKDAIGSLRFDEDLDFGEDTLFLYEFIRKGISAVYTTEAMYYYRGHEGASALRFSLKGISDFCNMAKRIESGEQECKRTENARNWEGEYLRHLKTAMEHLEKKELYRMRADVAEELKNPYFRQKQFRARTAIFLAFFCYPLYRAVKASYNLFLGNREKREDASVPKNQCCGCGVCMDACPHKAITMAMDREGFFYPRADREKCTGCGICGMFCPMKKRERTQQARAYLGVQAKEDKIRFSSSSGGVFPVLAEEVLACGGVVFGAVMAENGRVYHRGIHDRSNLAALQKTKYVQSDMSGCYRKIRRYLRDGRPVLFTGTPCQCQAVKLYIGEEDENLLLADLVCYGVPSTAIWNQYVKELEKRYHGTFRGFRFRDKQKKDNGHTVVVRIDEREYAYSIYKDPYCEMYFRNYSIRPSCYSCRFCTVNRESDITMGDFWGIGKVKQEMDDGMGTSLVILHSQKGERIWGRVKENFRYFRCQEEEILQPRLLSPVSPPKRRQKFMRYGRMMTLSKAEKIFRREGSH